MFSSMCVCLSVYLSVQPITFELLHIETSFMVYRYIFTISRSSLSIKVIEFRSYEKYVNFSYLNILILCIWLQVINKVKVTHQDQDHIKVKVKKNSILDYL